MIGIAAVKSRRLEMLAGFEFVAKIEWIETAGNAHRIQLGVFHGNSPGTRPRQRAKPDFAMFLARDNWSYRRLAIVAGNGKPRIGLMAGGSAVAFDDAGSAKNRLLIQRPLSGPAARQIAQGVACGREGPLGGSSLFDNDWLLFAIFNVGGAREDARLRINGVTQRHINLARNVLQLQVDGLRTALRGPDEMKHQIAIAIGEGDFESRLGKQTRAPACILLRRCRVWRIKGSHFWERMRGRKAIARTEAAAPIERLQFTVLVDTESVRGVAAIETEDLSGLGGRRNGGHGQQKNRAQNGSKTDFRRDFHLAVS